MVQDRYLIAAIAMILSAFELLKVIPQWQAFQIVFLYIFAPIDKILTDKACRAVPQL